MLLLVSLSFLRPLNAALTEIAWRTLSDVEEEHLAIVYCRMDHLGDHVGDSTTADTYNPVPKGVGDGCLQRMTDVTGVVPTDGPGLVWYGRRCIVLSHTRSG